MERRWGLWFVEEGIDGRKFLYPGQRQPRITRKSSDHHLGYGQARPWGGASGCGSGAHTGSLGNRELRRFPLQELGTSAQSRAEQLRECSGERVDGQSLHGSTHGTPYIHIEGPIYPFSEIRQQQVSLEQRGNN